MNIHSLSQPDFTLDASANQKIATDEAAHVLEKTYVDHETAAKANTSLLDVMACIPGGEGIDFDPPKLGIRVQAVSLD
jgi:hypothetical protein